MTGENRGCCRKRHGVEAALSRRGVTPTVCPNHNTAIVVVAPHEPCILRLGMHSCAE